MKSLVTVLSAGIVAAAVSVGIGSLGHSNANPTLPAAAKSPQREVADEPIERHVLEEPVVVQQQPVPAAPTAKAQSKAPSDDATQAESLTYQDMRLYMDQSFEREVTDATWSRTTRADIQERLQKSLTAQDSVRSLDCRSTMCRVGIHHADATAFARLSKQYMEGGRPLDWPHEVAGGRVAENADGSVETMFYLAREGMALPRLE